MHNCMALQTMIPSKISVHQYISLLAFDSVKEFVEYIEWSREYLVESFYYWNTKKFEILPALVFQLIQGRQTSNWSYCSTD